MEKFFI